MVLFIFIVIVAAGFFTAWRLLAPEMYVALGRPHFPWNRPRLLKDAVDIDVQTSSFEALPVVLEDPLRVANVPADDRIQKMELLLLEKNKTIDRLQKSLQAERGHRTQFEKIKTAMDEEILRLKTQLKSLKQKDKTHA